MIIMRNFTPDFIKYCYMQTLKKCHMLINTHHECHIRTIIKNTKLVLIILNVLLSKNIHIQNGNSISNSAPLGILSGSLYNP